MSKQKLTEEQRAAIAARYAAGEHASALAAAFGVRREYISMLSARLGKHKRVAQKKLTPEQRAEIAARYVAGESTNTLADEYGITAETVCFWVKRADASPRGNRKLTKEQKATIVARYAAGETSPRLATEFNISDDAICNWIKQAGVSMRDGRKITREQKVTIAARYAAGETSPRLAADFGISTTVVLACVRQAAIPAHINQRRCFLREDAFSELTPESRYWIGFLMADGCVHPSRGDATPVIALLLAVCDRDHIEKFKAFLGASYTTCIHERRNGLVSASLSVGSRLVAADLARYGVVPNKTFTACIKDDRLFYCPHFWRGMVDGDGCVRINKAGRVYLYLVGTAALLSQFQAYVRLIDPASKANVRPAPGVYRLTLGPRTSKAVLADLYLDCPVGLDRKVEKALSILQARRPS